MLKSITFEVIGNNRMVCEGCEQRVEHALKALPGVHRVQARARNQCIEVLFDAMKVDPMAIAERISGAGYETRVGS